MKVSWLLLSLAATVSSLSARDLVPQYWIENVSATDGSVQTSLVFRTIAGVNYRVETSEDLISWMEGDEVYGMGHEFVVPMCEYTSPPPPAARIPSGHSAASL